MRAIVALLLLVIWLLPAAADAAHLFGGAHHAVAKPPRFRDRP